ncbi:CPBP family intramembrane glutamic endopeptidase [Simkania negevensis]|uniref:CAAX prenyl protease 2/Lysostaphin resistance protein A-like domain-containing protein n=1 Tax=Simkania negevensis (strain ATCC VR-1471 / DSM 27360 / Z) TaxID=331113 RepID=F8L696_SIMNZ|nr:CPBP family intramembrane glutamic endopeptidase [Simkania negevensis]MCB1068541.1 CPBP family intramembrane metalloprotease [Simkania sp.]MCB1074915.1 CPBP family intramembrane metalloprotease [Simkania sp.]CCB88226.1 unknown protein [Simkania negevensis Z]
MTTEVKDNFLQATFRPYFHVPTVRTVAIGLGIGAGALVTTYFCFESCPWFGKTFAGVELLPKTESKAILYGLGLVVGVVTPFFEESQHRAKLENPSHLDIGINSLFYGLISGLLPGSLELRVARVFLGTLTGLFFCAARVAADDVWAPAIAHTLCNLAALKSYF